MQGEQAGNHQHRIGHQGQAYVQQQLGMGLQMGDVAARDQRAGGEQQCGETIDHRQQDPAVETASGAGHEGTDDEAHQGGHVQHAEVLSRVGLHYLGTQGDGVSDQGERDAGKQLVLSSWLGAQQQVQGGDDGQQIKRQGQNRDHDHNQVVVEQAVR